MLVLWFLNSNYIWEGKSVFRLGNLREFWESF